MDSQFQKFSEQARRVLLSAQTTAASSNSATDTGYILLAMLQLKDSLAYSILISHEITAEKVELCLKFANEDVKLDDPLPTLSVEARICLERALNIASQYGHVGVDTEHLLLAMCAHKSTRGAGILKRLGVNSERIRDQVITLFQELMQFDESDQQTMLQTIQEPSAEDTRDNEPAQHEMPLPSSKRSRKNSGALEYFTVDLTKQAEQKKLDKVIGRDAEIERVMQILSRRTKNNPVLIGEPGVGKSAIAEAIAQRIVTQDAPPSLIGKQLLSLDLALLVAGTMYRGQFEERIKKIIDELMRLDNAILFIDELHTIVGAGSAEGSLDAAQILKPALAKGKLRVIGATTLDEFQKHIEKDAALTRRFQPVKIDEPSVEDTIAILEGIRPHYESHHQVTISDDALQTAAKLSNRYITERFLPDKAIDVIDEAAASIRSHDKNARQVALLTVKLDKASKAKEQAVSNEDYNRASKLQKQQETITKALEKVQERIERTKTKVVTPSHIETTISKLTGVPTATLASEDVLSVKNIDKELTKHIIGQSQAIEAVTKSIRRSRTGIGQTSRPIGSFIFLGPSGVGKSETAKMIAQHIYGKESALIKIDMSEFMERHNVSRLVGAPAGYVGYEEGGKLTEAIRRQPYSVLLLDEIEKAHPDVFNLLLQILEDGYVTDAKGRRVDFRNTLIIMTSNLGVDELTKHASLGFKAASADEETRALAQFEEAKKDVLKTLKENFRPEFLNRIDQIVVFNPLTKDDIRQIVDKQIDELSNRVKDKGITMQVDLAARKFLVDNGYEPENGARPIRRLIQNLIEDQLADAMLDGKLGRRKTAIIRRVGDELVLT